MNTLPPNLVRFRRELEDAIRRDLVPKTRRRTATRLALAAAAAVAVALGVLRLVSNRAPAPEPASAAGVVKHARLAITPTSGAVLHVETVGTQRNGDGTTVTWTDDDWLQVGAPDDWRQVETTSGGGAVESAVENGVDEVYDPSTNTIYESAPSASGPKYDITPGSTPGTYLLHLPGLASQTKKFPAAGGTQTEPAFKAIEGTGPTTLTITAAQARALRNGTDIVVWKLHSDGTTRTASISVVPAASEPSGGAAPAPDSPAFRQQILAFLNSGAAHLVGHATIDGQDTLEIDSADGTQVYYVDPTTYAPVELDTHGTDGGVQLRFTVYDVIPPGAASDALVSLTAQHPTATVDTNQADYQAAENRLFPHG